MLLGAHESIAGGLPRVFERAEADGAEAIQIFSRSSSQWAARPLPAPEVAAFRRARRQQGSPPMAIHDSYLINLASGDEALQARSLASFVEELRRAARLGIGAVVMHPGSPGDDGEDLGIERITRALNTALRRTRRGGVRVLLENTAGQGAHLGWRFEHLRAIIDGVREQDRIGVCFDTQHAFAAGYDLRSPRAYARVWSAFERIVGLDRLGAFHLNDSKRPLGARVDRHEHIGQGAIGARAFRRLVRDERFQGIPGYLETPGRFRENLDLLKHLRGRTPI